MTELPQQMCAVCYGSRTSDIGPAVEQQCLALTVRGRSDLPDGLVHHVALLQPLLPRTCGSHVTPPLAFLVQTTYTMQRLISSPMLRTALCADMISRVHMSCRSRGHGIPSTQGPRLAGAGLSAPRMDRDMQALHEALCHVAVNNIVEEVLLPSLLSTPEVP